MRQGLAGLEGRGRLHGFQLGEARHRLANASDIHFWLGETLAATGDAARVRECWTRAATFKGDG